jgi:hypothetical protein
MHRSMSLQTTRRGIVAMILALVALLLSPGLTVSAQTETRDEATLRAAFAALRTTIVEEVPTPLQPAFLAKVDAAEIALLLPAVQAAREEARASDCAAQQILEALHHQVQGVDTPGRVRVVFPSDGATRITGAIDGVVAQLACPRGA